MFTGLVEGTGLLEPLNEYQVKIRWIEASPEMLRDLVLGDSVSVDGVCLTVARNIPDGFIADVSPETLVRSTLGNRTNDCPVNLERSLTVGGKIGGHFVTGHIDGVGQFCQSVKSGDSWELSFAAPPTVAKYIVSKGSIAINGISLTVAEIELDGQGFKVAVIPHTYESTNLSSLSSGDFVNLEGDILGKYVEQFLRGKMAEAAESAREEPAIDLDFLSQHGYK
ncbi:MAG: riboflavin synthase [Synechococcus sp.]